jgi:hypothetical protein
LGTGSACKTNGQHCRNKKRAFHHLFLKKTLWQSSPGKSQRWESTSQFNVATEKDSIVCARSNFYYKPLRVFSTGAGTPQVPLALTK